MAEQWAKRWNRIVSVEPVRTGVYRVKEGGCIARGRARSHDGQVREIFQYLPEASPDEARAWLEREQEAARQPPTAASPTMRFVAYATSLGRRKVADGTMKGAHSREVYVSILKNHLAAHFGGMDVREIRRADILAWRDGVAARIAAGEVSPHTANSWFSVLRAVINAAVSEFELDKNPVKGVGTFSTAEHPAHTYEEPNSLTAAEAAKFLATMKKLCPQHYAMTVLGFATGLRPSSLRPLRRHGPQADVLWNESALLVRRSHTRRDEVMNTTKTSTFQRIDLPTEILDVLRSHIDDFNDKQRESDLLFPTRSGGFRSPSVLDKPFKLVAGKIGLTKRITPKGMRRTFQDLARAAQIGDVVTRSISGHATKEMRLHYSTPYASEQREGIAKVIELAGVRKAAPVEPAAAPARQAKGG